MSVLRSLPSLIVSLLAAGLTAHAAPPANDNFADSQHLFGFSSTLAGDLAEATVEEGETAPSSVTRTVWYTWMAPATGRLSIGTNVNNGIKDYDFFQGDSLATLESRSQNVVEGQVYHLRVKGDSNQAVTLFAGTFGMNTDRVRDAFIIGATGIGPMVDNGAATLSADFSISIPLVVSVPLAGVQAGKSIWFKWTAPQSGPATFSTQSDFDTVMEIGTGDSLTYVRLGSNDDGPGGAPQSQVVLNVTGGQIYAIGVYGKHPQGGVVASGRSQVRVTMPPKRKVGFARTDYAVNEGAGEVVVELSTAYAHASPVSGRIKYQLESTGETGSVPFTIPPVAYDVADRTVKVPIADNTAFSRDPRLLFLTLEIDSPIGELDGEGFARVEITDDDQFTTLAGTFDEVFIGEDGQPVQFHFTTTAKGRVTGKVMRGGKSTAFSTYLNTRGEARITLPSKTGPPFSFTLGGSDTGKSFRIQIDEWPTQYLETSIARWSAKNPVPNDSVARYSMILSRGSLLQPASEGEVPLGAGCASFLLERSGRISITGFLADGTPFSSAGAVNESVQFKKLVTLPKGKGVLLLNFAAWDFFAGQFFTRSQHIRPPTTDPAVPESLRAGFNVLLEVTTTKYRSPDPKQFPSTGYAASNGQGQFTVYDPELQALPAVPFQLTANGRVTTSLAGLKLKFTPKTGIFQGTYLAPGGRVPRPVAAVVFQNQEGFSSTKGVAFGFSLGPDDSMFLMLDPLAP